MKNKMKPRKVYHLTYDSEIFTRIGGWVIKLEGSDKILHKYGFKEDAIYYQSRELRMKWKGKKELAQLIIHRKDGRFHSERTYGKDPIKSKG